MLQDGFLCFLFIKLSIFSYMQLIKKSEWLWHSSKKSTMKLVDSVFSSVTMGIHTHFGHRWSDKCGITGSFSILTHSPCYFLSLTVWGEGLRYYRRYRMCNPCVLVVGGTAAFILADDVYKLPQWIFSNISISLFFLFLTTSQFVIRSLCCKIKSITIVYYIITLVKKLMVYIYSYSLIITYKLYRLKHMFHSISTTCIWTIILLK